MQHLVIKTLAVAMMAVMATQAMGAAAAQQAASHGADTAAPHANDASGSHLQLRWELLRNEFPRSHAKVRLTLRNLDTHPLPDHGWGIYFTTIDGVVTGPLSNGLVAEQVGGQLFRFVPGPGFVPLKPGANLTIDYAHPSPMTKTSKTMAGPYLVYDDAPDAGQSITNFRLAPINRPEQLDTGPDHIPLATPQSLYALNAKIIDLPRDQLPPVFPTPQQIEQRTGVLHLTAMPTIEADTTLANEAALARTLLQSYLPASVGNAKLHLHVAAINGQESPEAYVLTIDPSKGIDLQGASAAGVFLGLQSLRDLLPLAAGKPVDLPALRITDAPRFAYRGFQLDVARNFQPKQTVFRLLDLMARYKLNKFHFHLTDDEGWRLAIAGLPELTDIGAHRGHTLTMTDHLQPAYGSGPSVDDPHGSGFYTRADYIEILKYAAARYIDVIPELEMPGHARAAVKAMDARFQRLRKAGAPDAAKYLLHDADDKSIYTSPQLYHDQVLNPGMPSTYTFIEHVIGDVAAIYREAGVPLQTIHVGGDELPDGAWEKSPASLATMQREHLAGTADLWDYFYDHVDQILKRQGLTASGWEELGARKVTLNGVNKLIPNPLFTQRGFQVQVWNNLDGAEDFAYRLANAGYNTVLSPVTNFYFDMAYNKNIEEPGVNWGAYIELGTVYDFIPFDYLKNADAAKRVGKDGLTDYGQRHIAGLEATLFTETIRDIDLMDYLIMPRLLGLAERAWAPNPAWALEADPVKAAKLHDAAWSGFVNQLGKRVLPRLDAGKTGIAYRIAPPGLIVENGRVLANHQLPGLVLRYTTDGSEPTASSALVSGPITARGTIKVAAFAPNGRAGRSSSIVLP